MPGGKRKKEGKGEKITLGWIEQKAFGLLGMSRKDLYRFTLAEFLNAWKGYTDEKELDYRTQMEAARLVLSGLVKKPPSFPWEKSDSEPYTEEEKQAIAATADRKNTKKQILTNEGWKDVHS